MPYVHRDADGTILAVYQEFIEGTEEIDPHDPTLKTFIEKNMAEAGKALTDEWLQSDLALARVLEDLIEILMDKKVISFTDFPEGAQLKLRERRGLRKEVSYVEDLFVSEDDFSDNEGGLL